MNTLVTILITVGCTLLANVVFWSFFYGGLSREVEESTRELRIHDDKLDELTKAVTRVATICEIYIGRHSDTEAAAELNAAMLELQMRVNALQERKKR